MGVFAQTDFEITCDTEETAKKIKKVMEGMAEEDGDGNFHFGNLSSGDGWVSGDHCSDRIQNLEWQCEHIWEKIKDIKGIEEALFPFMVEGDGCSFYKGDDEE